MSFNIALKLIFARWFYCNNLPQQGAPQGPLEQRAEKNASAWLIIQKGATLRMEHVTVSLVI